MYSDPSLIRKTVVKLSPRDREAALLDGLCAYTGEQRAVLMRELLIARAVEVLHGGLNFGAQLPGLRGTFTGHSMAN